MMATVGLQTLGRLSRAGTSVRARLADCVRLHCHGVAMAGLLATLVGLGLSFYLWAGQRFAPPPVSFVGDVAPLAVHFPMALAYSLIGTLLAARQPRNPIGWLFLAVGLTSSFVPAVHNLVAAAGNSFVAPGPVTLFLAWLVSSFHLPLVGSLLILVFLVFPDGRALSPRWWIGGVFALGGAITVGLGLAVDPRGLLWYPMLPNPFAGPGWMAPTSDFLQVAGMGGVLVGLAIATTAMVIRYRAYTREQREPLKWIAAAVGLLVLTGAALMIVRYGLPVGPAIGELVLTATLIAATLVPLAAGIGILRYRLFDIDLILNHALVYVPLSALMTGIYTASVALFQRVFVAVTGDTSDMAIIFSTLILASAFTPMRKFLEGVVDRHFKPLPRVTAEAGPATASAKRTRKKAAPSAAAASVAATAAAAAPTPGASAVASPPDAEATMRALLEQLQSVEARLASLEGRRPRSQRSSKTAQSAE